VRYDGLIRRGLPHVAQPVKKTAGVGPPQPPAVRHVSKHFQSDEAFSVPRGEPTKYDV